MKDLFTLRSIEEKLVDESKERYEAAVETERSSQAAILTSHAHVIAFTSKVDSAKADVDFAESEVEVAEADLEKQVVQLGFATVTAPFDGVVTQRSSFPGDFVRSANEGGSHEPILTVQRTDRMRVVVQIPDRDVPYAGPGDPAVVSIDSLGGKKMNATISRIARFEDPLTRLMQIEIDLPNPVGEICHGMYGKVTIMLDRSADQFSIPSSCLVGKSDSGTGAVYVAKDNRAHLVQVQLGIDNAVEVGILKGIDSTTDIVLNPGNGISEGALLTVSHDAPRIVGSNEKR